ncbi:tetratricopeptide repeat protein [Micromonospora sp. C95]|uniref:tetratricopeptide repeat protein n=1 Tax=Micromonospora sp. C95 TaxID=2824882 RepID=UPI001B39185D|nr:tetratricopeptide repeat protein [Micromonospora sp. C95]MBQ1024940.1 trypsin-like peptidase domain-containing protein [Micromonospora sp. C95]
MTRAGQPPGGGPVASRQLRRHVVRVAGPHGTLLGTGFFIAPGWVVTAAHVVFDRDRQGFREAVRVTPAAADVGDGAVPADVVAHSDPPERTILWPFPDLALLRLKPVRPWVGRHPVVWTASGEPLGDDCHAYGFAARESTGPPPGAPARFVFEGVDGDGFFRLKSGQAAPGLSGAPLLCPTRRAVVGVLTGTRDRDGDLGGWAAPISALLGELPGVPEALVAHGRDLLRLGAQAVLADRRTWHAVLPVPEATALRPSWEGFVRMPGSLPAEMLLADARVVPYRLRDEDLAHAVRWCERPTAMEVWRFAGVGGAGKTRHAIELCRAMDRRGWLVVRWTELTALPSAVQEVAGLPLPRLIVIDYVEAIAIDTLRALLDKLRRNASQLAPVRVVLLTRTTARGAAANGDLLRELGKGAEPALRTILSGSGDPIAIRGLPLAERRDLYGASFKAFRRAWFAEKSPPPPPVPPLGGKRYEVPLEVLLEAFDRALSDQDAPRDRAPVDRALDHEARHWNGQAPAALAERTRRAAVALASLAGAEDDDQADELLQILPELRGERRSALRGETLLWLSALYAGPLQINPVRPDLLGEALVAETLAGQRDAGRGLLAAVFDLADDGQVARSLDLLARLAASDAVAATAVAAALFDRHTRLADRAEVRAHGGGDRPGNLDLAIGLQRLLTGGVEAQVEEAARSGQADDSRMIELSTSYNRIGDLARDSGQSERAEALYTRALGIRERLAWARPDDEQLARELSISYNKLGRLAAWLGQPELARGLYEKGLAIRERLHKAHPGDSASARDLAVSRQRLAEAIRETGDPIRAEALYRQVLDIRERLFTQEPNNPTFARDLSISYDVLGDLALESDPTQARHLYERGHQLRERLASDDPDNVTFARDLSVSYERLGDLAAKAMQFAEARRRYELALDIRRRLRDVQPRNTEFSHDLLVCHGGLGELAAREGQPADAERHYRLGLDVAEDLLAVEPRNATFVRDALFFYTGLGALAAERGDGEAAERFYRLGRTRAERMLAAEPGSIHFARHLASFYERLGELSLGGVTRPRSGNAETLLSAAAHVRRDLRGREPANVELAEELAQSLLLFGRVLAEPARTAALAEAREALEPFEHSGRLSRGGRELLDRLRPLDPAAPW